MSRVRTGVSDFVWASNESVREQVLAHVTNHESQLVALNFAGPLPKTNEEWIDALGSPLLFAFEAAKRWQQENVHGPLTLVALADRSPSAEVGAAVLKTFARSLQIESAPKRVSLIVADNLENAAPLLNGNLQHGALQGLMLDLRNDDMTSPAFNISKAAGIMSPAVAVVTGAARGIGFAIASRLASDSYSLVFADVDERELTRATDALAHRATLRAVRADVRCKSDLQHVAQIATQLGSLSLWVNNAGISVRSYIRDLNSEDWTRVLETNLRGAMYGTQVALEHMCTGGTVVNISSTAARTAGLVYEGCYNAYSPYAASKAGIDSLTRASAIDAARVGVRVNGVAPGPIRTELLERVYSRERIAELASHIPSGRLGEPEEVASAVAYLASPAASFISGHVLTVDGGLSQAFGGCQ
jgi:NAD(P)-dependent dehydrogenase (short-subunit alcohol dehydrogenase family)